MQATKISYLDACCQTQLVRFIIQCVSGCLTCLFGFGIVYGLGWLTVRYLFGNWPSEMFDYLFFVPLFGLIAFIFLIMCLIAVLMIFGLIGFGLSNLFEECRKHYRTFQQEIDVKLKDQAGYSDPVKNQSSVGIALEMKNTVEV